MLQGVSRQGVTLYSAGRIAGIASYDNDVVLMNYYDSVVEQYGIASNVQIYAQWRCADNC